MYDLGIASLFRDSQSWHGRPINQVDRYFRQLGPQAARSGLSAAYFLVEGNSADDTWDALCRYRDTLETPVFLTKQEVEGPDVASVVDEARFRNLSALGNTSLRQARDAGCGDVLWVESDFILPDYLLGELLKAKGESWWDGALGVCPVPRAGRQFYDTWAFEGACGERWGNHQLSVLTGYPLRYRPMNSFGSCALLNGANLRRHGLDFGEGCFPALCRSARGAGLSLWCDTFTYVDHPAEVNLGGRLV